MKAKREKKRRKSAKEGMKGIQYRVKDGVGPDPRKHNFQRTVGSVICDCVELGNRKKQMVFFAIHSVL